MGGGGGVVFFFNDTATTEIYTLSLHDALPIYGQIPDAFNQLIPQLASLIIPCHIDFLSYSKGSKHALAARAAEFYPSPEGGARAQTWHACIY